MSVNLEDPVVQDLTLLLREADRLLNARQFEEAVAVYERAAALTELPAPDVCARFARALRQAGRPAEACEWALKVVDGIPSFSAWTAAALVLARSGTGNIPRVRRTLRVAVAATWTTSGFVPLLKLAAARLGLVLDVYEAPFGQYFTETLDRTSDLYRTAPEALILCPDDRALGVASLSEHPDVVRTAEADRWTAPWATARAASPMVIVQHSFAIRGGGAYGHFGAALTASRSCVVADVNRRLAEAARDADVGIVDVDGLASRFGKDRWFDDRNWYLAKVGVAPAALPVLARHTAAVLAARLGLSRRCLVLDLDNTLWGGVVGDDGIGGLTLGEGPDGEAFVDFQRAVKELSERGIVLAVCSKNDPDVAKQPFTSHPEMILKLDDISLFAANWRPKSDSLVEIARALNLGLESLAFVDDNPYERAEVRRTLPSVDVITLPSEPTGFRRALEEYPFFEPASITLEDRLRTSQYAARAEAERLRVRAGSLEEYQAGLGMVATIGPLDVANMGRVVQLINKTNQFNLTTRRRERHELEDITRNPAMEHFWVRLRDRFGDHGLVAVVIAHASGDVLEIDTLLMSCRVIGRGLETAIVDELVERARARGCGNVAGVYVPTARNGLVADLYPRLGFAECERRRDGAVLFAMPVGAYARRDAFIHVERHSAAQL